MGTSDRIERERQAKRTLILEAARELFLERGYQAVTLRSVAQRIEHSTTAVYVHFKDKRDLVTQMVAEDFARFDAALLAMADVQPPLHRLVRLGEAYIEFALALPKHYQLLFMTPRPEETKPPAPDAPPEASEVSEASEASGPSGPCGPGAVATDAELMRSLGPMGTSGFGLLLATVQECMAQGAFHPDYRDSLAIAQAVWAGVHGLVSLLIIMGDMPHFQWRDPKVLHQLLVGSMVRGMQAPPARLEATEA